MGKNLCIVSRFSAVICSLRYIGRNAHLENCLNKYVFELLTITEMLGFFAEINAKYRKAFCKFV